MCDFECMLMRQFGDHPPSLVTVACSTSDGYVPLDRVGALIVSVLETLRRVFRDMPLDIRYPPHTPNMIKESLLKYDKNSSEAECE